MSFNQYVRRHMILVVCLLVIGYGIAAYIYIACPERIGQPHAKGVLVDFAPIYNEDGSTFHARLDIGYQQGLLIFENVVSLFCVWLLYKIIAYYDIFFGIKGDWSYLADFVCAAAIARLPMHLSGRYVLDYLYIKGRGTYDFFDFCIGICVGGILIWYVVFCVKYRKYKKEQTAGMRFWERFKWAMKLSLDLPKVYLRPMKTWWTN